MMFPQDLVDILVCPKTRQKLSFIDTRVLKLVNDAVASGLVFSREGSKVTEEIDQGLITEEEVRGAFRATRELAQQGRFRERFQQINNERRRGLILDPDGLDKWLNVER